MKNKIDLPSKIHFIGIGGAGMNPLAGICLRNGVQVTGSDSTPNKNQDELRALGADIWTPHSAEELKKRDLPEACVFSTAISIVPPVGMPERGILVKGVRGFKTDNPEVIYLKEKGVQFWHRSDLLQKIADQFEKQIVISGTHGKTTTTAMLVWILEKADLKPCWVLGGVLKGLGSYGWNEQREIFIFEGDESDQSFLKSNPYIGLVTSLEPDHLENYENSFAVQVEKFQEFVRNSHYSIINLECLDKNSNLAEYAYQVYGYKDTLITNRHLKSRIEDASPCRLFELEDFCMYLYFGNGHYDKCSLKSLKNIVLGKHNILNSVGASIAAHQLSIDLSSKYIISKNFLQKAIEYLRDFPGIYRRFEIIGTTDSGITVIDDYAHHPTEVRAAIKAGKDFLRERNAKGKLIVCFQPHLPTRLRDLWKEFSACFEEADELLLNDLYIARGNPIEGIDSPNLFKEIKHLAKTYIPGKPENMIEIMLQKAKPNDLILLLGAGDITYIREKLFEELKKNA